jgi:hypothetical protein
MGKPLQVVLGWMNPGGVYDEFGIVCLSTEQVDMPEEHSK